MDIAKRLNDICNHRGLTGYRLAKLTGVPQAQLHQYMAGQKSPGVHILEKICLGLEMSLSEFFADSDPGQPEEDQRFDALHQLIEEIPEERRDEVRRFLEFTIQQHKNG